MKQERRMRYVLIGILSVCLLITMVPIVWCISLSFDHEAIDRLPFPVSFWPHQPSIGNFLYAFDRLPLFRQFFNTLVITISNTVISVFTALMCGYAFAKGNFFLKKFWFLFILAVMMMPFESRLVPLFLQYTSWGMNNTYWPMIINGFVYSYGIYFARQNISTNIPDSLRESAYIDGAHEWRIFFTIIVPLSGPLIATLCILQVLANWNSYLLPLVIISDTKKQVISVGVSLFNSAMDSIYYGPRMSVALISSIPLTILFLFFQRYIVQSIAVSGIKQ